MMKMSDIGILTSFIAGVASFLSPCVLPLVPGYISFIAGISVEKLTEADQRKKTDAVVFLNALFFVIGFTTVFVLLGASATSIGRILKAHSSMLSKIASIVIIIFGVHLTGLFRIPLLYREKKLFIEKKPPGLLGSFIVGMAFAFGWTPCIGPILGSILLFASTKKTLIEGLYLLIFYSLGLGIPFILSAAAIDLFLRMFSGIKRYIRWVEVCSGILIITLGILIFTNNLSLIGSYLSFFNIFSF